MSREVKRRWRDYRTAAGRRPVKDFFDALSDTDAAAVVAAMKEVQERGTSAARHLGGDIYEVRAEGDRQTLPRSVRDRGPTQPGLALPRRLLEEDQEDAAGEHPSRGAPPGRLAPARSAAVVSYLICEIS
jgi:hypothetical protein